jgi:hypothetical protein
MVTDSHYALKMLQRAGIEVPKGADAHSLGQILLAYAVCPLPHPPITMLAP